MVLVSAFEEEFNISIEPEEVFEMYRDYKTFKTTIMNKMKMSVGNS
jgi:acyl carrier protein